MRYRDTRGLGFWIGVGTIGGLILGIPARGQTLGSTNEQAVVTSNIVVVTATRLDENPINIPQSISIASSQDIQKKQPSQPVEAVKDMPGVWVQKTGAGGGTPIVRGMMGNQVLYLVDGIRINNGRLFSGPNAFFNQMDVGSIDQIEVLKGPGSVQYGSDALGGVINTRTKTLNYFPSQTQYGGLLSGHYTTVDKGSYGHAEGYVAGSNFNALVGVTSRKANDFEGGADQGELDNTSSESRGFTGKFQYKPSQNHLLTFGYLEERREDVERYDQSKRNASGIPRFFSPEEVRRMAYVRDVVDLDSEWISRLESYAYAQRYTSLSWDTSESTTKITRKETDTTQAQYGGGLQALTPLSESLNLVYGADGRYETSEETVTQKLTSKSTGKIKSSTPYGQTPDGTYDVEDAFAMLNWDATKRLRLNTGARFESAHLNSDPDIYDTSEGFSVNDLDLDKRWDSVTYNVGGLYWLSDNVAMASDLSTGFRSPTYSDVLSFGASTFNVSTPSPDVEPEQCTTWELGPRFESKRLHAQITGFHTWLKDLITSQPSGGFVDLNGNGTEDAGEMATSKQNSNSGWIQGIEGSAEWQCLDQWALFGDFTATDSRDEELDEPLRFTPPLNGKLGVKFRPTPTSWWIEAFARMVAAQDKVTSADKTDPARASDPAYAFPSASNPPLRSDYSIPGYTTYHARMGIPVRKATTIFLGADNLTDKKYREAFSRLDAPGINFTIGAEMKF